MWAIFLYSFANQWNERSQSDFWELPKFSPYLICIRSSQHQWWLCWFELKSATTLVFCRATIHFSPDKSANQCCSAKIWVRSQNTREFLQFALSVILQRMMTMAMLTRVGKIVGSLKHLPWTLLWLNTFAGSTQWWWSDDLGLDLSEECDPQDRCLKLADDTTKNWSWMGNQRLS